MRRTPKLMRMCCITQTDTPASTNACWLPYGLAVKNNVVRLKPDADKTWVVAKVPDMPPYHATLEDHREECVGVPLFYSAQLANKKPGKVSPKLPVLRDLVPCAKRKKMIAGYQKMRENSGLAMQAVVTGEEFCELFINISRKLRGRDVTQAAIAEEVADVLIVMDKMCHYFGISKAEIEAAVTEKTTKFLDVSCQVQPNPVLNEYRR